MDLFETINTRRSVRAYETRPVEEEKLNAVLTAANQAPSAGNLQSYQIYIVRDETKRRKLGIVCMNHLFMGQAPLSLVFCADTPRAAERYGAKGESLFSVQDATIAVSYAQLAATALGLATCWIGAFEEKDVIQLLGLPSSHRPIAILSLGYPAEAPAPTPRRALSEIAIEK